MLNAIGYHTYAGGLAVGVARHFNLAGLGEHDGYGDMIKTLNFPNVPLFPSYDRWPKERGRGAKAVPFIFSNPPCAIFSVASAGRSTTWEQDPRLQLWKDIVRLIPKADPDILAIESVVPAWTKGRVFCDRLAATAAGWGYSTTILLHNAKFLGAVQDRKRIFILFHKINAEWPEPDFDNYVTVRDVLKGVKVSAATWKRYSAEAMLSPKRAALYELLPNGGHLHKAFNDLNGDDPDRHADGRVIGRPGFLTVRLKWDAPGPVFMGSGHILHPQEPRSLYPEEINAYAGFPPEWVWPDYGLAKLSTFASQGVSPLGGSWLGRGALASIERGRRINRPTYAVVDGLSRGAWGYGRQVISDDPGSYARPFTEVELATAPAPAHGAPAKRSEAPTPRPAGTGTARPGSGARIRELLKAGGLNQAEILVIVHREFPTSKAGPSDIAWNRAKLRKDEGVEVVMPAGSRGEPVPALRAAAERYKADPPWEAPPAERQATTSKRVVADREFDQTSLTAGYHGQTVHRDYGAHFFRWGFAGRFINSTVHVLDVGCGVDCALAKSLILPRSVVPASYTGVDISPAPRKFPGFAWSEFHWGFNFIEQHRQLKKKFDLITNFEVIEHMAKPDGEKLLAAMRDRLAPGGTILVSTPVFNGKAAANHIHEWTIPELTAAVTKAKLKVVKRFGTFASWNDIKKAATPAEFAIAKRIGEYYGGEVLACFLAPLYPDASRNNVWMLKP